jgi:hypothetical protein
MSYTTLYRKISATELEVGKPLTSQLIKAIRDNPLAYRTGDSSLEKRISYKAFSTQQPVAGDVMIAQSCGHDNETDTIVAIKIRREGQYRVKYQYRSGARATQGDGNIDVTRVELQLMVLDANGEIFSLEDNVTVLAERNTVTNVNDIYLYENDIIYVTHTETDGAAELSFNLSVGVADTNAIWGVDAIPHRTF